MEPTNHPFGKENNLQTSMSMFHANPQGCILPALNIATENGWLKWLFLSISLLGRPIFRAAAMSVLGRAWIQTFTAHLGYHQVEFQYTVYIHAYMIIWYTMYIMYIRSLCFWGSPSKQQKQQPTNNQPTHPGSHDPPWAVFQGTIGAKCRWLVDSFHNPGSRPQGPKDFFCHIPYGVWLMFQGYVPWLTVLVNMMSS